MLLKFEITKFKNYFGNIIIPIHKFRAFKGTLNGKYLIFVTLKNLFNSMNISSGDRKSVV